MSVTEVGQFVTDNPHDLVPRIGILNQSRVNDHMATGQGKRVDATIGQQVEFDVVLR